MVFNNVINFIKRVSHTKVVLLTVPYRHNLKGPNITLNDEISNLNRKLLKLKKLFPHISVVEINEKRHLYTKHGLHLNRLGKEILSLNLAHHIFSLIEKENNFNTNIIALRYYEVQSRTTSSFVNQLFPSAPAEIVENTSVKRIRKKHVTKRNDFFMGNLNLTGKCYNPGLNPTELNKGNESSIIQHSLRIYHQNICGLKYEVN
jgi:hypothetical protein